MKNLNKILIFSLIAICVLLLWDSCKNRNANKNLLEQISQYKISEKQYTTKRLSDSSTISQQQQTLLTQKEAEKLNLVKLDGEIKKLKAQVTQSQKIKITQVEASYVPDGYGDTSEIVKRLSNGCDTTQKRLIDDYISKSIIVPKKFEHNSKWYYINGTVNKQNVFIDSLSVINDSRVQIGFKKTGFLGLGKKIPVVEIKNSNPYFTVNKMDNVVIKDKKSIFDSKLFWALIGAGATIYLTK